MGLAYSSLHPAYLAINTPLYTIFYILKRTSTSQLHSPVTMSDENDTPQNESVIDSLGEQLGFDIDRIRAEIRGEEPEHETGPASDGKGPVRLPTDEDIVDQATSTLIDHKQRDEAQQMPDVEDHRSLEVELDIDDPHIVIHKFATALYDEHEALLAYLYENSLFDVGGPSLEADEDELMTYIIEERNEANRPAVFIGGASPLRMNLSNQAGLTEDESRLVKLAHTIAARKNGYDRHLLLDEVVSISLEDPGKNPYQAA